VSTPTTTLGSLNLYQRIVRSVFAQQVGVTMGGQALTILLGLMTTAIIARWLGPTGKGQFELVMLIPQILSLLLSFGISTANVYFSGIQRVPVAALSANSVAFSLVGSALGGIVLLLMITSPLISRIVPGVPVRLVCLAMLSLPLALLGANLSSILLGLRRFITLSGLRVFQAAVLVPLLLVSVKWLNLGISGAIVASIMASAFFVSAVALKLRREGGLLLPSWNYPIGKATLSYGLRGYVGNLLQFFNYRLDSFLVNLFIGAAGVGIYSVAIVLAELLWQLPNAVSVVIFPKAANSDPKEMNRFTPRVFWVVLGLSSLGAVGLGLTGKAAIRLIFSERFLDAYSPMLVLLPGVVLLGAGKVLSNDMAGRGYPHYNSIVAGLTLVATLVLDLVLIPKLGVLGAALASTVAYSSTFVLSLVFFAAVRRRPVILAI